MITQNDKAYLSQLKVDNPDTYQFICNLIDNYRQDTRLGCHDIANIISLVFGNFQLIELTMPEITKNTRWNQMSEDVRYLVSAMEAVSHYRYSHLIKTDEILLNNFINEKLCPLTQLPEYNGLNITFTNNAPNLSIHIDIAKFTYVIKAILDNIADNGLEIDTEISININDNQLIITITDNGSVIDETVLTKIFHPFNSNKPNHIGLSLASSYQILMAHNGTIEILPTGEKGCIHTICIPIY